MAKQDEFSSTSNYANSTEEWEIHPMETKIPPIAEKMFHSHQMVFQANESHILQNNNGNMFFIMLLETL